MICSKCNHENPDGAAFCQNCGAALTGTEPAPEAAAEEKPAEPGSEPVQTESPETDSAGAPAAAAEAGTEERATGKKDKKVVTGIVLVACLVVLCLIVGVAVLIGTAVSGNKKYTEREAYIYGEYLSADDKTVFSYNAKLVDAVEGKASIVLRSSDGACAIAVLENSEGDPSALYCITKKGAAKMTDDVSGYSSCAISADGKYATYVDRDNTMYRYQVKSGKSEKIADGILSYGMVLSPNGKIVLYCTETNAEPSDGDGDGTGSAGTEMALHYWKNGKTGKLGKNLIPISVSNNGKYIYAVNLDMDVYSMSLKGDDRSKIDSGIDSILLNRDGTEALISADGKYYLSVKGKEKVKIGTVSAIGVPILPNDCNNTVYSQYYPIKSFLNAPLIYRKDLNDDWSLGYIEKDGKEYEIVKVASDVSNVTTPDGKVVYYMKDDTLCRIKLKENAKAEELTDEVVSYKLTDSGKYIYLLNEDDALCRLKGTKLLKVADDVESTSDYCLVGDGVLFMVDYSSGSNEGCLYYSKNGKSKKLITEEASEISSNGINEFGWYRNSGGDFFITENGKKYTQYR